MSDLAPIHSETRDFGRKVEMLYVENISVGRRHRALNPAGVDTLAASMSAIGQRTPISVRVLDEGREIVLVAGAHRLEAAKRIGWEKIESIVYYEADEVEAELWEIAENLHRAELTKEQRDEHIRRYAELLAARKEVSGQIEPKPQGGRPAGLASKIAVETGLSKSTVARALNPERVAAEKSKREAAAKEKAAQQAEFDRQREEARAELSDAVKDAEVRKAEARATRQEPAPTAARIAELQAEIEELHEANVALEAEMTAIKADNAKWADMRVQFEQGGFETVIAGKDEEIRVLETRLYRESADKAKWMSSAEFWKKNAVAAGWSDPRYIEIEDEPTGEAP